MATTETLQTKWTPGPWSIDPASGMDIIFGADHSIAAQALGSNWPDDARLIAASPCLYAALDEAVNYLAVWAAINSDDKAATLLNKCTAALAKANGE